MFRALLFFFLLSISLSAQECSPYFDIPTYELSSKKSASIGYVACLHAGGVVAEVGYDNVFVGVLAMGGGHNNETYSFIQYDFVYPNVRFYGGPVYRIVQNPSLLIGRFGTDFKLYSRLWGTASILQVNTNLNYFHFGVKLVI